MEELRYPIGRFQPPRSEENPQQWIDTLSSFPESLQREVEGLTAAELGSRYRPEGWTIRQVVHHCADSHMHAYLRFKWALTENQPTIKPYQEAAWAELPDVGACISSSVVLLQGLHTRWSFLLSTLSPAEWERHFFHPELGEKISLRWAAAQYAWHCDHHLAHIRNAKSLRL